MAKSSIRGFLTNLMVLLAFVSTTGAGRQQLKGVLKTIKITNGDTIDCVDIYKQPAFNNPLLKNHTMKLLPTTTRSSTPADLSYNASNQYADIICQECQRSCPEGTIPILRPWINPTVELGGRLEEVSASMAIPSGVDSWYTGVSADISIWKPFVPAGDYSNAHIVLQSEHKDVSIQAGWSVFPSYFEDSKPRSFISWNVRIGNESRGCINLFCPGFVQTNRAFVLGGQLPASTPGSPLKKFSVRIKRNVNQRAWWVKFNKVQLGFFPYDLLKYMSKAKKLFWAGRVRNNDALGSVARTEMGNGHFPSDGFGNAAHFGEMKYFSKRGYPKSAKNLHIFARIPHCYNMVTENPRTSAPRAIYGGPGGPHCYQP